MDRERWRQVDRIFEAALQHDATERAAFLAGECASDQELRAEVESLLAHHVQDSFLENPAGADGAHLPGDQDGRRLVGETLASYRILRRLGMGAASEVYLARYGFSFSFPRPGNAIESPLVASCPRLHPGRFPGFPALPHFE